MKIAVLYPNSESCRYISAKLIETGYTVRFYCPDKVDLDMASNIIFEMNVLSKEQEQLRGSELDEPFFEVLKDQNLEDCDIIGEKSFPTENNFTLVTVTFLPRADLVIIELPQFS